MLELLQADLEQLRNTYKGVSKHYAGVLNSLKESTLQSSEAAKRSARSAEQSRIAALNAMNAAKDASRNPAFFMVVELLVKASIYAAVAAIEASAAATAASAAAALAVSQYAEDSLLKASTEAAAASRMAADSAAEAVKLSNEAREIGELIKKES
jgi:hypothetical protein